MHCQNELHVGAAMGEGAVFMRAAGPEGNWGGTMPVGKERLSVSVHGEPSPCCPL